MGSSHMLFKKTLSSDWLGFVVCSWDIDNLFNKKSDFSTKRVDTRKENLCYSRNKVHTYLVLMQTFQDENGELL